MGVSELSRTQLDGIYKRIIKEFSALDAVKDVFTLEKSQQNFIEALLEFDNLGFKIKVGGRSVRNLMGYSVIDFSANIVSDAFNLGDIEFIRLGPLIEILKQYPQERMKLCDLDFFIEGANPDILMKVFKEKGFNVSEHQATGGIWIVEEKGENGVATFVDFKLSWQTGDQWALLGMLADFIADSKNPHISINIGNARLECPLEIPVINPDPLYPQRVAAIARALLWAVTVKDPNGDFLNPPFSWTQDRFCETVTAFAGLLEEIRVCTDPAIKSQLMMTYKGPIRDMSIALRVIVLSDWDELTERWGFNNKMANFLNKIKAAWQTGLFEVYEKRRAE